MNCRKLLICSESMTETLNSPNHHYSPPSMCHNSPILSGQTLLLEPSSTSIMSSLKASQYPVTIETLKLSAGSSSNLVLQRPLKSRPQEIGSHILSLFTTTSPNNHTSIITLNKAIQVWVGERQDLLLTDHTQLVDLRLYWLNPIVAGSH
jgi:hypothetical protein